MGVAVMAIGFFLPVGNLGQVCLKTVLGAVIYLLVCRALRVPALAELKSMALRKRADVTLDPEVQLNGVNLDSLKS
jgi:hypothetical protein